ncbi:uncharacterized protein LOC120979866 [Bufo bufo]|uniref:uncharacterized protein LOC120979866 n=1 Tax=Bufo bufo TaxID=8384 RepID=UPI001ABDBC42|nr:uncharacterized protein LOC120979866 [Bufo bufo]
MAQRILLGFDALDKYSQDILAKHAKRRSLSYLQRIPSLRISLPLDFETEIVENDERTNSETPPSPRSSRYPNNTELGKTVRLLRPFTAPGHGIYQDDEREGREVKKGARPRCVSADRRRSWRSEVESIMDLGTLCHMERTGPVLSSLGAPLVGSPREEMQDSGTTGEKSGPERTSLSPDIIGCSRAENFTDHSHPSRENTQKAAAVSLCIEDEMKKSDIKIITVRQKTISGHVQTVSETHPIFYNTPINNLSDFQRNLMTRPCYFSSSQRPMSQRFSPMGRLLQNKMDYVTDCGQLGLQNGILQKSKANKPPSSDNIKVILHYLSTDGTKQRVEMGKDGDTAKNKQVNSPGNRKNFIQEAKSIHVPPTNEERGVGPIINGMNPVIAVEHGPSLHGRSRHVSRSFCPSSARTSSSSVPRSDSVREMQNWSYISISKPLSPPEGAPELLQKTTLSTTASPDLVKDLSMATFRVKPVMFTAKSVVLESRKRRPVSSPVGVNPIEARLGGELSIEGSHEVSKMDSGGTVESSSEIGQNPPVTEPVGVSSCKNESNEEQVQKSLSISVHLSASPVISIPTGTIESAE